MTHLVTEVSSSTFCGRMSMVRAEGEELVRSESVREQSASQLIHDHSCLAHRMLRPKEASSQTADCNAALYCRSYRRYELVDLIAELRIPFPIPVAYGI